MKKTSFLLLLFVISICAVAQKTDSTSNTGNMGCGGIVYYPERTRKPKTDTVYVKLLNMSKKVGTKKKSRLIGLDARITVQDTILTPDKNNCFSIKIEKESSLAIIKSRLYYDIKVLIEPEYKGDTIYVEMKEHHYKAEISDSLARKLADIIKSGREKRKHDSVEDEKAIYIRKPVIYLYPESKMQVAIKHDFKGTIHTTFPEYGNGWKVIAEPNGKLLNIVDNRHYNSLFWDGDYAFPKGHYNYSEGFYVSKADYASFLINKLSEVGLNETETNDFVMYWLPIFNKHEEVFIYFRINDDIGGSSKLTVIPEPETMIRLFMEFKKYDGSPKLPEQELTKIERKKFTLVEWGGSEIL